MKVINSFLWECLAIIPSVLMAQTANKQPNIVLILADDMGRECLGCYGSTYQTPNLDKLSEIGVRFDNCFSQPLSTPSRVQLMTGKYNNKNYSCFGHLNQKEKTFAHLAKDAGYTTMIAGKWQLGMPVIASVALRPELAGEVRIHGGEGVGRVTKPGLDQPVGEAAINHVPRAMIKEALEREAESAGYAGGFDVTISIEGGAETAKRTFNPHMGVEGGLSVLGTSGIVEPMSQQAILDTIQLEMGQAALRAGSPRRLILAPGNYGLDYLHEKMPALKNIPVVKTSNFIGDTMDMAAASHFEEVVLVGHIGKLVKLAGGVMNTHSRTADCRTELLCAHAALCGASRDVCAALMNAATTDACMEILDEAEMREPVLSSLLDAIQLHLDRRAAGAFRVGAVLFSNQYGPLGQTRTVKELLDEWKNG